jgi:hypothetical protein
MADQLSLARAALRLSLTYHQVRALVLRGDLRGGQDASGRFYVEAEDVERYLAHGGTAHDTPRRKRRRASGGR